MDRGRRISQKGASFLIKITLKENSKLLERNIKNVKENSQKNTKIYKPTVALARKNSKKRITVKNQKHKQETLMKCFCHFLPPRPPHKKIHRAC